MKLKKGLGETCYRFFSTLANPTRLAILELLREGPKSVTEIAEALDQEQSMISHNLEPLESCRFVFSERRKKQHFYTLNKGTMEKVFKVFSYHTEKYCPTKGRCLTQLGLKEHRKKRASEPLYLTHE